MGSKSHRNKEKENGSHSHKSKRHRHSSNHDKSKRRDRVLRDSNHGAALARAEDRADRAERRAGQEDASQNNQETITRPRNLDKVKVADIQGPLGMDDLEWHALRTFTRHRLHAGNLRRDLVWKAQDPSMLARVSLAINEQYPDLKRSWSNIKEYASEVGRPDTYIGRKAAERRGSSPSPSHRRRTPTPSPSRRSDGGPSPSNGTGSAHPRRLRSNSDEEDDGGDDMVAEPE
ncbi:hypothetical protein GGX14DRAFT_607845 [Mycena pura]|uniref:Uncharacterized protein n=1 Tax=Mycena pura TaxID=153505 RepID=A0AAD6UKY1_9AGAR|nr:hypothetical protein GGX14DRAFT_607845 [Mycena pura]